MLSHKTLISLGLLAILTACGFQPVYGNYSAAKVASTEMQTVRLRSIPDRIGQQMTNKMVDRLYTTGRPKKPLYDLEITLTPQERDIGIQKDATATRGELMLTANVAIYSTETQAELYRTSVRTRVAYNILEGQYGNQVARENSYDRAMDDVASEITNRVALFLNRAPDVDAEIQ